jgi:protein-tyrosine phosphatase
MKIRRRTGLGSQMKTALLGKILRASRRVGGKCSFMDITWLNDRLAVGGAIWRLDNMTDLARMGVTHVINMQSEFDDTPLADACGVELLWNAIDDDFLPKPPEVFWRGVEFATNTLRQDGSKLYIHCAAGVHRAPMMTLALLCAQGMELLDAVYLIERQRPVAEFPDVYLESVRRYLKSEYCPRRERRIWSR